MNILVFRGYTSSEYSKEVINIGDESVNVTMVPIGEPRLVRKKFKQLLSKYNLDDYDYIYLVSMSSCMTSIIDKKYFNKLCLITPFYLHLKPIRQLLRVNFKDFLGCHILILLNGRMGVFDKDIRVILAELDEVTDNNFFQEKFEKVEVIKGINHSLEELGVLNIVKNDIKIFLKAFTLTEGRFIQ